MKQLQLDLKERLIIVEPPVGFSLVHFRNGQSKLGFVNLNIANPYDDVIDLEVDGQLDLICKGSELTEDIAKVLVEIIWNGCKNYNEKEPVGNYKRLVINTALQSFISAIESKGYHWGENPEGEQPHNIGLISSYPTGHPLMDVSLEEAKKWLEAESRTFNSAKCLIFKLL